MLKSVFKPVEVMLNPFQLKVRMVIISIIILMIQFMIFFTETHKLFEMLLYIIITMYFLTGLYFSLNTKVNNGGIYQKSTIEGITLNKEISDNNRIYNQIISTTGDVKNATRESFESLCSISNMMQEVTNDSETQMTIVSELNKAMEEMAFGIQRIAENSTVVSKRMTDVAEGALEGTKSIQAITHQMDIINTSTLNLYKIFETLGNKIAGINQITNVISNIASQTNLLSLNASIEAARAGENGKGFNIVALEVRKHADKSKDSVSQIVNMLNEILDYKNKSLEYMKEVENSIKGGISIANATGKYFEGIMSSISGVSEEISDMSATYEEMSASSEEILAEIYNANQLINNTAESIKNINDVTMNEISSSEQITAAAFNLNKLAQKLMSSISENDTFTRQ